MALSSLSIKAMKRETQVGEHILNPVDTRKMNPEEEEEEYK